MRPKTDKQQNNGKQCSAFQSHSAIRFAVEITDPLARAILTTHIAIKGDQNREDELETMPVSWRPELWRLTSRGSRRGWRPKF